MTGQLRSSAPCRCARSTRESTIAASPRRARWVPSDPGPSASRSAPRTEAAGRWPGLGRAQPSFLDERARARGRPALEPGEGRGGQPAGDDEFRAAVRRHATDRDRAPSGRAACRCPRARPATRPPSRTRSSGPSISIPRRDRRRRSATGTPATSASQRGSALSVAQVRHVAEHVPGTRDGHDVGGVAVVGQGARAGSRRRPRRTSADPRRVPAGPPPTRARPGRHRPCRSAASSRSRAPKARSSGGPATIVADVAPAARNPRTCRSAHAARASAVARRQRPGIGSGQGMEDRDGDRVHRPMVRPD